LDLDHVLGKRIENGHGQSPPDKSLERSLNPAFRVRSTLVLRRAKTGHIRKANEIAPSCAPRSAASTPWAQSKVKPSKLPTKAAANSMFIGAPAALDLYNYVYSDPDRQFSDLA
jgi:hypothetical protein